MAYTDPTGKTCAGTGFWSAVGCFIDPPPPPPPAPILGNAQVTNGANGPEHAATSTRYAQVAAQDPGTERVSLNQKFTTITGSKSAPGLQPDVAVVSKPDSSGTRTINITEVRSTSQTAQELQTKYQNAMKGLPEGYRAGSITVVEPGSSPPGYAAIMQRAAQAQADRAAGAAWDAPATEDTPVDIPIFRVDP